jgi:predicted phage tail component-like protein
MRTFTFDNISSAAYFYTHSIERQIMPPLEFELRNIPKRAGAIPSKTIIGVREIEVEVSLYADSWEDLRTTLETVIAPWLYTEDPAPLIFSDEPNRIYYAKLSGETSLEELIFIGTTKLTFVCADPYKYATAEKSILFSTTADSVFTNAGTAKVYPKIRVVPTGNQTTIKFTNVTTGKAVLLNNNAAGQLNAWKITIVDNSQNLVYDDTTKARTMDILDLSSDFFFLQPGDNTLRMEPLTNMSARLIYTERFL